MGGLKPSVISKSYGTLRGTAQSTEISAILRHRVAKMSDDLLKITPMGLERAGVP